MVKLKGLKKSYKIGQRKIKRILEPSFQPYSVTKTVKRLIGYSTKRKVVKRKPKKREERPEPKVVKDARKPERYPSGKRIYAPRGPAVKTRPYSLRLPAPTKPPYSLAALYPHKIKPTDPRGKVGKRVYKYIGPYPNPLGMSEIFDIKLSKMGWGALFSLGKKQEISRLEQWEREYKVIMIRYIYNKLNELYYDMKEFGDKIIDRKIPLGKTGKMRGTMKRSLERRPPNILPRISRNMELKMFLHADVPYAGVVTGMDRVGSPHVAHSTSIYPKHPEAKDPHAVKKGYYVVLRDLKFHFRKLYRGMMHEIYTKHVRLQLKAKRTLPRSRANIEKGAKGLLPFWFDIKVKGYPDGWAKKGIKGYL